MGPRLIDTEHTPEPPDSDSDSDSDPDPDAEPHNGASDPPPPPSEETGLLRGSRPAVPDILHSPFGDHRSFFPSTRKPPATATTAPSRRRAPFLFPRKHWARLGPRTRWWLLFLADFLNAPLAGALVGALVGFVPALHGAFFDGVLTAWLTASLRTVGSLFVPLPVVVAGTSLYAARRGGGGLPWGTVAYVMVVRFVAWPAAAVGAVYLVASRTGVLGSDPMLWFAMMLMPW